MSHRENPYNWRAAHPRSALPHPLCDELARELCSGKCFQVVGGHGMGKTVLLHQIAEACRQPGFEVVFFRNKPAQSSPPAARVYVQALADRLGLVPQPGEDLSMLVARWFDGDGHHRLVLLFDEVDRYVEEGSLAARDFFNALASANGEFPDRLGVAIAGGLGIYHLRVHLGSDFSSRAAKKYLAPFTPEHVEQLATEFATHDRPLGAETLKTLFLLSGGIPALVTYGLETLWEHHSDLTPDLVAGVFERFRDDCSDFESNVHRGLGLDRDQDSAVYRIWRHMTMNDGPYSHRALRDASGTTAPALRDHLHLLQASGLVRIHGRVRADPLVATCVMSILRPEIDDAFPSHDTRVEQLREDLRRNLARIGRLAMDFFHDQEKLVHESVFSAVLAVVLQEAGWSRAEREPVRGPGEADIALSHPRFPDEPDAIVELKIWPRNDYQSIHKQVTGYCVDGEPEAQCAVAVMIAQFQDPSGWPTEYEQKCLAGCQRKRLECSPPLTAMYEATREDGPGAGVRVTHFLLNLTRRARQRP